MTGPRLLPTSDLELDRGTSGFGDRNRRSVAPVSLAKRQAEVRVDGGLNLRRTDRIVCSRDRAVDVLEEERRHGAIHEGERRDVADGHRSDAGRGKVDRVAELRIQRR